MVFTRLVKWIFRDVYFKMFLIQNYRGRGDSSSSDGGDCAGSSNNSIIILINSNNNKKTCYNKHK